MEVKKDGEAECDAGDWEEIAELSQSLDEVAELNDDEDKITGCAMMKKVCTSLLTVLSILNIFAASKIGEEIL